MKNEDLVEELFIATSTRNVRKVDKLMQYGADPCTPTKDGVSSIHNAALLESPSGPQIINKMLNYGADPNTKTPEGLSPLHIAAMWGRVQTLNILLDHGANVAEKDYDDKSALDYAEEAEEMKYECIDALTRFRPKLKTKTKEFKTKSRSNLTKIVGKTELDTSLNTSFNETKQYNIGNGSLNVCSKTNRSVLSIIDVEDSSKRNSISLLDTKTSKDYTSFNKTKDYKPAIRHLNVCSNDSQQIIKNTDENTTGKKTSVSLLATKNVKDRSILKSIQASPIVKATLSKFKNNKTLSKSQSRIPTDIIDKINKDTLNPEEMMNLNETLFQTCCEYFDQSIRETHQDINNIISSTFLDGISSDDIISCRKKGTDNSSLENYKSDYSQPTYDEFSSSDKENEEMIQATTLPDKENEEMIQATLSDKENGEMLDETFWSVYTSPQLNPHLKESPITLRKKQSRTKLLLTPKKTVGSPKSNDQQKSPLFIPRQSKKKKSKKDKYILELLESNYTDSTDFGDNSSLNNFLLEVETTPPHSSKKNRGKKDSDRKCKKCHCSSSKPSSSSLNTEKDEDLLVKNLSNLLIEGEQKNVALELNNADTAELNNADTAEIDQQINLLTEETIDYSNSSNHNYSNVSDLIQYYEDQNEAEVESSQLSFLYDSTNKSYVELEGINTSGKLVKKYVSFFDCTKDDCDDIETVEKRRENMKEYMNITVEYDWMDVSQSNITNESNESVIQIPHSIVSLTNVELRERLVKHGESPGPISTTTRCLYQRYLAKLEKNPQKLSKNEEKYKDYPYEMRQMLLGILTTPKERFEELESEMSFIFSNPDKHTWREGTMKTSFNYLLMDPRVTKDLPVRAESLSFEEQFRIFAASIFYIGKGKNSRPYEHFHEAAKYEKSAKAKPCSNKVNVILDIWNAGYGVTSVHIFHSIIPVEAYTREACMIEAMSLPRLTNVKRGDYYGPASSWTAKRKRLLGIYLLKKSLKIYLIDGERQIRQRDLTKR